MVDRYSGWRSWATTSGTTPYRSQRWSRACRNERCVARCSRSPMWWLGTTTSPLATLTVLFSSAPTASTGRWAVKGSATRLGRVAPGPPQHLQPARHGPHDRVVAADVDRPVVGEQPVDHAAQPAGRVLVVVRDRLVAQVPAGHHQRPADVGQQEVVERAVRQQQAEVRQAGRHAVDDLAAGAAGREDDGTARRGQRGPGRRRRGRTAGRPPPGRRPSPRTACRRAPCAGAARPPPRRRWRRPRGGSRRCP